MKIGINLNIDVTKLDKSKFYEGKSGKYASLTVFVDTEEKDQYGNNGGIYEAQSKEDREAKAKKNFVGNAKVFYGADQSKPSNAGPQEQSGGIEDLDIPFNRLPSKYVF